MRTVLCVVLVALGCGSKDDGTASGSGGSSTGGATMGGSTSTGGGATDSSGTSGPTTGDTETTGDSGTTGDTGATGDTTGGSTTGGGDRVCEQFCGRMIECGLDAAFGGCPCEVTGPMCATKWEEATQCFEAATCTELQDEAHPCWERFVAAIDQC
ncbi:hypothetical protein [Nannocystis exedens]|nr:hypothetical protein [Nannocystis exedens]